jgi:hypothetical protein
LDWLGRLAVRIVRIQLRAGAVKLVRNRIKIVGEQPGVHIQRHGRRGAPEHLLHGFDIDARRGGETGRGVTQFVPGESKQPGPLGGRVEEPWSEVGRVTRQGRAFITLASA